MKIHTGDGMIRPHRVAASICPRAQLLGVIGGCGSVSLGEDNGLYGAEATVVGVEDDYVIVRLDDERVFTAHRDSVRGRAGLSRLVLSAPNACHVSGRSS